jgi:hypothetical protein
MTRPLLITDCDDVLLHMLSHFGAWLEESHAIDFDLRGQSYDTAMKRRDNGEAPTRDEMWALLNGFFDTEMHRQTLAPFARESLLEIAEIADVVVLTNLEYHRREDRVKQLADHGIHFPVHCNQGGKGRPVRALIEQYAPSVTIFIDDLAVHHESVANKAPHVWRLHMHMEPDIAPHIATAPHAHHRLDDWQQAKHWIIERMQSAVDAPHHPPRETVST